VAAVSSKHWRSQWHTACCFVCGCVQYSLRYSASLRLCVETQHGLRYPRLAPLAGWAQAVKREVRHNGPQKCPKISCRNWTRGMVSRRGQDSGARGWGSGQLSAVSYQLLVVSHQLSVCRNCARTVVAACGHCPSFSPHPAPCLAIPIAALRTRSAAIEPEPETLAVTKTPIKQAPNASKPAARKVQLQR
jgi:hypothetical protein